MRGKSLVIFISVFVFALANSQDHFYGGLGYFNAGVNFLNFDKLNKVLSDNGLAQFGNGVVSLGGGGFFIVNNVMIGGEGFSFLSQKKDKENYRSIISGGAGFFKLGYILHQRNNFQIYPMIGIGGGGLDLKVIDKTERNFNNAISERKDFNASFSALVFDVSVGADLKLGKYGYFILGVKTGYLFSPVVGKWKAGNEVDLKEGPEQGINGFYLKVSIGGGGGAKVKL